MNDAVIVIFLMVLLCIPILVICVVIASYRKLGDLIKKRNTSDTLCAVETGATHDHEKPIAELPLGVDGPPILTEESAEKKSGEMSDATNEIGSVRSDDRLLKAVEILIAEAKKVGAECRSIKQWFAAFISGL